MSTKRKISIEKGSVEASATFYIKVTAQGPYLVYGHPSLDQEVIIPNAEGNSWSYQKGKTFPTTTEPIALCRCGASGKKPFCDGSHAHADWNPQVTASKEPLLDHAEITEGPLLLLADNEKYCAFARFCDAYGRVWNIVERANTPQEVDLAKHEVGCCPAGRLVLVEKESGKVYEPDFEPSLSLLEDPGIKVSGPIWVKGGIRIESPDGSSYEIRNRVTLCRCGQSSNKPFCDGTHAAIRFEDELPLPK